MTLMRRTRLKDSKPLRELKKKGASMNVLFCFSSAANEYAKKSSKIYRNIGYNSMEEGAYDSAINYFEKAAENEKYLDVSYDYDMAKNLQGMALANA